MQKRLLQGQPGLSGGGEEVRCREGLERLVCWREATLESVSSPSSLMGSGGVRTEDGRAEGHEVLLYGFQVYAMFCPPLSMSHARGPGQCHSDRGL